MVFSSTDMFRERELERGDDLIGFMSHFATFFLVHFECEKTNRERERDDDVADDDFNDDSDDDENDRGSSKSTSFLLHAQSKRGGFLLLLLLEIVVENKDDDFLIVQKFRRGRAKERRIVNESNYPNTSHDITDSDILLESRIEKMNVRDSFDSLSLTR